jgi:hypothetical protein
MLTYRIVGLHMLLENEYAISFQHDHECFLKMSMTMPTIALHHDHDHAVFQSSS